MMDILEIKKYPEIILRKKCQPVNRITEREKNLFQQMLFIMHHFDGIGLAGPQIGIQKQVIVADIGEGSLFLANPKIIDKRGSDALKEGCLSIPEVYIKISRSYEIVVTGLNQKGETQEINAKGLMARVLQHEIDHLEGKLIIDYFSLKKRMMFEAEREWREEMIS
ncbi:MAG: peptide deformylase [Candidatus Aceula meridiana]|nr:peptide deformylase [Candidatus Aceula meridiana]